jgi:hypothetical protein
MTSQDVLQMLDDFNSKLANICQVYELQMPADEDLKICQVPGVDSLLSFETKVNYLCEFFNAKHLEMNKSVVEQAQ